jgi:innexin
VPKSDRERRQNELRYYQWIPFILLLQAFCFYFPHIVWRSLSRRSGIDVRDIVDAAINYKSVDTATKDDKHKAELMEYIVEAIDKYVDDPRRQADERGNRISVKRILMTVCIFMGKYLGNYLIIVYFTTKALFITNAVCQIFLLNLFLGQEFHLFGIQVLSRILEGRGENYSSAFVAEVTPVVVFSRLGYPIALFP